MREGIGDLREKHEDKAIAPGWCGAQWGDLHEELNRRSFRELILMGLSVILHVFCLVWAEGAHDFLCRRECLVCLVRGASNPSCTAKGVATVTT